MELWGIPGTAFLQGGAGTVLAVFIAAILTGRLVPRQVVEDVRRDRDARLDEWRAQVDQWREAYRIECQAREQLATQVDDLLEVARATERVVQAMQARIARQVS